MIGVNPKYVTAIAKASLKILKISTDEPGIGGIKNARWSFERLRLGWNDTNCLWCHWASRARVLSAANNASAWELLISKISKPGRTTASIYYWVERSRTSLQLDKQIIKVMANVTKPTLARMISVPFYGDVYLVCQLFWVSTFSNEVSSSDISCPISV